MFFSVLINLYKINMNFNVVLFFIYVLINFFPFILKKFSRFTLVFLQLRLIKSKVKPDWISIRDLNVLNSLFTAQQEQVRSTPFFT